jgi:hypothetical protein
MRFKHLLILIISIVSFSCQKNAEVINQLQAPVPNVLLKDVLISNLPSPYYHFEYDNHGRANFVSFASEFLRYKVVYNEGKIAEMRNNILVNKDRLQYFYDDKGMVTLIKYADSTGNVFEKSSFTYNGQKLIKANREHKVAGRFILDRTMTMVYYDDGNLMQLTDHRPANSEQTESTLIDRFEQYDNKINVDGFSLLHPDFFEHLFLLPQVQLQKNNPAKETLTSNTINYQINYTYTYNEKNAPLTKKGDAIITNSDNTTQTFKTSSTYTYY